MKNNWKKYSLPKDVENMYKEMLSPEEFEAISLDTKKAFAFIRKQEENMGFDFDAYYANL